MTRRSLFALFAAVPAKPQSTARPDDPCPVGIVIGAGPSITVTIPRISKENLADVAAMILGKENPDATTRIRDQFRKATDVTLILTTKCEQGKR